MNMKLVTAIIIINAWQEQINAGKSVPAAIAIISNRFGVPQEEVKRVIQVISKWRQRNLKRLDRGAGKGL